MASVRITKSEVVARQMKAGIRLFFQGGDPVAIHTLIAAAHQILVDVGKAQDIHSVVKNTAAVRNVKAREFIKGVNYPFNFFKHADRDSTAEINIEPLPRFTQDFIMDAVLMLQGLTDSIPFEAKVFWAWFVSQYPQEFDNLPEDGEIAKLQELRMAELPYEKILDLITFNDIVTRARA